MSHLKDCLKGYTTLKEPEYAVLVTGEWGAGKSFQVKNCIPEDERLYVSLYGVQTVDQLHSEVSSAYFRSMTEQMLNTDDDIIDATPWSWSWARAWGKKKTKQVMSYVLSRVKIRKISKAFSDLAVAAYIPYAGIATIPSIVMSLFKHEMKNDKILVFDDLERSNLELKVVFGAINFYLEHRKFRVVVVAHDERLSDEFLQMKEKIFGQTVHIEPEVDEVLTQFIHDIQDGAAKKFLAGQVEEIVRIFACSQVKSLRILRHAIINFSWLYGTLTEKHRSNSDAMEYLTKFFLAFQVEVRSGRLSKNDLWDRDGTTERFKVGKQNGHFDKLGFIGAQSRYPSLDLESELLNDNVLNAILIEGRFPEKEICASIDNSSQFLIPDDEPPWKIVYHFDALLDDDIVESAIIAMNRQFEKREITNPGQMLHIFSLRVVLAKNKIIEDDVEAVLADNNKYIDDLMERGDLPPYSPNDDWYGEFGVSFDELKYRFIHAHGEDLRFTVNKLKETQEEAFLLTVPTIQEEFLKEFEDQPKPFLITLHQRLRSRYSGIAVLHLICPARFVDTWLKVPQDFWSSISSALERRCEINSREERFPEEQDWAVNMITEFEHRAEKTGLQAYRIRKFLPKLRSIGNCAGNSASRTTEPENVSMS